MPSFLATRPDSTAESSHAGAAYYLATSRPVDLAPREAPRLHIGRSRLAGRVEDALGAGSVVLTAGAGCGKTVTLEQVLGAGTRPFAWVACSPTARSPGVLATMIVNAIAAAVPGSADALAERVVASERARRRARAHA